MTIVKQSDIVRLNYTQVIQTDPSGIANPPSGEVYSGVYDDKFWLKFPSGVIEYPFDGVYQLALANVTGAQTLTAPEGYLIQSLTVYQATGLPTVSAGSTLGGKEFMYPSEVSDRETATINQEISETGSNTVYVTISGGNVNAYLLLLKNR